MNKIFFMIVIFLGIQINAGGIKSSVENEIKSRFGNSNIEFHTYILSKNSKKNIENFVKQKFFSNKIYYWAITDKNGNKSIAILDNVLGKTMPITFLVFFNSLGSVKGIKIIKYREDHGGEIANQSWLNQFNNKNEKSSFDFGKEIDGISGATISAKSITKGIRKLSLLFKQIIKSQ